MLTLALIVVILIGEVSVYGGVYRYDSDFKDTGEYSISDSGIHSYKVIVNENDFAIPTKLYIYQDDQYGTAVHDALVEIGAKPLDESYYISQLINNLGYYGFKEVSVLNAQGTKDLLMQTSDASGKALLILSGAIPDLIYSESNDILTTWIASGGTFYWVGNIIGRIISHADGTVSEYVGDCETQFVSAPCSYPDTENPSQREVQVFQSIDSNEYRSLLSLKNNNILYALNTSLITTDYLSIGYTDGAYSSITYVKNGNGQVCVMGGDYSNNQRMDLATIIASGMNYTSTVHDMASGTVHRGKVSGNIDLSSCTHPSAFIYLGGDFSVYGRLFTL